MAKTKRTTGRAWMAIRAIVIERDAAYHNGIVTCEYCGRSKETDSKVRIQVDHVIPLEQGGTDMDLDNLVTSCHKCNGSGGHWYHRKPKHIEDAILRLVYERNRA
jgi:5-methylcytosine-specific restriction endonuclease McrA